MAKRDPYWQEWLPECEPKADDLLSHDDSAVQIADALRAAKLVERGSEVEPNTFELREGRRVERTRFTSAPPRASVLEVAQEFARAEVERRSDEVLGARVNQRRSRAAHRDNLSKRNDHIRQRVSEFESVHAEEAKRDRQFTHKTRRSMFEDVAARFGVSWQTVRWVVSQSGGDNGEK